MSNQVVTPEQFEDFRLVFDKLQEQKSGAPGQRLPIRYRYPDGVVRPLYLATAENLFSTGVAFSTEFKKPDSVKGYQAAVFLYDRNAPTETQRLYVAVIQRICDLAKDWLVKICSQLKKPAGAVAAACYGLNPVWMEVDNTGAVTKGPTLFMKLGSKFRKVNKPPVALESKQTGSVLTQDPQGGLSTNSVSLTTVTQPKGAGEVKQANVAHISTAKEDIELTTPFYDADTGELIPDPVSTLFGIQFEGTWNTHIESIWYGANPKLQIKAYEADVRIRAQRNERMMPRKTLQSSYGYEEGTPSRSMRHLSRPTRLPSMLQPAATVRP